MLSLCCLAFVQSVATQWGSSDNFTVEIVNVSSSSSTQIFDVDANYNGSIPLALAAVAEAGLPSGTAEVILGSKAYIITEHLAVPAGTSIKGAGATATTLTFSLRPPQRGEPGAGISKGIKDGKLRYLESHLFESITG